MHEGLYESVVTPRLAHELALSELSSEIGAVDPADQGHVIARHIGVILERQLSAEKDADRRLALAKRVLLAMAEMEQDVEPPVRVLRALRGETGPGLPSRYDRRPATPLNDAALLTNSHGEP